MTLDCGLTTVVKGHFIFCLDFLSFDVFRFAFSFSDLVFLPFAVFFAFNLISAKRSNAPNVGT